MKFSFCTNPIPKLLRNASWLLLSGLVSIGTPALAGEPVDIRSSDVALSTGGLLSGTVLNTAALPVAGVGVSVLHEDKVVAKSMSNEKGEFTVKGLRNGAHVIKVGTTQQRVRLWSADAAPPAAVENIAVVVNDDVVRGQAALGALGGAGGSAGMAAAAVVAGVGGYVVYDEFIANDNKTPASP
jgi:hypothetical protein